MINIKDPFGIFSLNITGPDNSQGFTLGINSTLFTYSGSTECSGLSRAGLIWYQQWWYLKSVKFLIKEIWIWWILGKRISKCFIAVSSKSAMLGELHGDTECWGQCKKEVKSKGWKKDSCQCSEKQRKLLSD